MKNKLVFTLTDLVSDRHIQLDSARVMATRYFKKGEFIRLKKNFYTTKDKWLHMETENFYSIANFLQVPSYISLMTALSYYEITTQIQQKYFESICLKRTNQFEIEDSFFSFHKIQKTFYFGFERSENFFIATKEKAFLDCIYLFSFGKYSFDFSSIERKKLDKSILDKLIKKYPLKTQKVYNGLWKLKKNMNVLK